MRVEWDWVPDDAANDAANDAIKGTAERQTKRQQVPNDAANPNPHPRANSQHNPPYDYAAALTLLFKETASHYEMNYDIWTNTAPQRVAVMVSQHLHCFYDVLLQWYETDPSHYDITCVISNHHQAQKLSQWLGVPFHYIEIRKQEKERAEAEQLQLLAQYRTDLVILARYMQILSESFIAHYPNRIINIHHSFLPAFVGAKPYHQAYARGVKIIGATSHYATVDLDQGPIIAQDVCRITHNDTIRNIVNKGKNLERTVLNHAVQLHLQRRIYVHENKTVVFE